MGQAQQQHRAVLIVEDDAALRSLTAALLEDEQLDTIECESAEAALAIMLIGGASQTFGCVGSWMGSIWRTR
jgi:DNA-binding NtrC family response regulator